MKTFTLAILTLCFVLSAVTAHADAGTRRAYYAIEPTISLPLANSLIYTNKEGVGGNATFARTSTAYYRNSAGTWTLAAANAPRFGYYWNGSAYVYGGLLIERAATNHVLNSESPATQTTGSLSTGTHCLWVEGSGSCAVTAGTATITGAGTATAGTPVVFVVTGAGTVTLTVSGSLTRFQCENSNIPTSYIPTAGATAARTADTLTITWPDGLDTAGTAYVKFVPLWGTGAGSGYGGSILGRGTSTSGLLYVRCAVSAGFVSLLRSFDGTNNPIVTSAPLASANMLYSLAVTWGGGTMKNYVIGSGSQSAAYDGTWHTAGVGTTMSIGAFENAFFRDIRIWNGRKMSDAEVAVIQ